MFLGPFFHAFGRSLLQGPLVALVAFPAAILASAPAVLVFFAMPLLLFVPFLVNIVVFLVSHVAWTVAARMAGRLSGLQAQARAPTSFMTGWWSALPFALLLTIFAWLIRWTTQIAMAEAQLSMTPSGLSDIETLLEILAPVASALLTFVMVLIMVPYANGVSLRHADAYGIGGLLLRLLIGLPMATALAYLAAYPIGLFISYALESPAIASMIESEEGGLLKLISFPVFYGGVVIWLTASILVSLEAGFLARLEGAAMVDRFSRNDAEDKPDYRALRQEWSKRG